MEQSDCATGHMFNGDMYKRDIGAQSRQGYTQSRTMHFSFNFIGWAIVPGQVLVIDLAKVGDIGK